MKIAALCKTFGGEEWVEYMIKSIYPYVEKIVFVNSDISWTGRIKNRCRFKIREYMRDWDSSKKIINLEFNTTNQTEQCEYGYKYIKEKIPCDYVMLIDTDEVWDDENMKRALAHLQSCKSNVYRTRIYTYIKSPLWRVSPIEQLSPVCFVKSSLPDLGKDARACGLKPYVTMEDVYYHHYVHVRKDFNTVLEKIMSSHIVEHEAYEDMSKWIPEVWNKLPQTREDGIHPATDYRKSWKSIEILKLEQMPKVLRDAKKGEVCGL